MKMLKNKFALSEHRYQFEYLQKQDPCAIIWALVSGLWKNSPPVQDYDHDSTRQDNAPSQTCLRIRRRICEMVEIPAA